MMLYLSLERCTMAYTPLSSSGNLFIKSIFVKSVLKEKGVIQCKVIFVESLDGHIHC